MWKNTNVIILKDDKNVDLYCSIAAKYDLLCLHKIGIYGKLEQFRNKDSMLLRCNSCNKESYEDFLEVDTDSQLYKCECGSSTFTPLNISEDFDIEILNY